MREIVVEAARESRHDMTLSRAVPTRFRFAPADPAVEFVGWCRATVRRVADRAVVAHREWCGPLDFDIALGSGEHTIDVQTGAGWNGSSVFRVPAESPVSVPLVRDG